MYDKCYFCLDQLPKLKKRIHSKLFRKFWRSRGTKEPAYITVQYFHSVIRSLKFDWLSIALSWLHPAHRFRLVEWNSPCYVKSNTLFSGVYEFTATINAETYDHRQGGQGLRPASWAIVKEGEEDKVVLKGLASQCKAQEKYKERLDLGVTWLKWLPTGMESKTRLAPKSNKVNSQKLTLN